MTNGINDTAVLAALEPRLGWKQSFGEYAIVDEDNEASASGRYFNDDSFHASVTIPHIHDCQPNKDIEPDDFNAYLVQLRKSNILAMLRMVFPQPQFIESGLLFEKPEHNTFAAVSNTGHFVGIRIRPAEGNYGVLLNNALLMFDQDVSFTLRLFNEYHGEIETWDVSAVANVQKVVNLNQHISYSDGTYKGGSYFLGYYQSELGSARSLDGSPNRNCFKKFNARSFAAETNDTDFERSNYAIYEHTCFGLNLELSSYATITEQIVNNAHLFDELQGLLMASKVMEVIINSSRINDTERITKEQVNVIYRELNAEKTEETPFSPGIKARIRQEIKNVQKAFEKPKPAASKGRQ